MKRLAGESKQVTVVDDQVGRLTFSDDLAQAIEQLLEKDLSGIFNVSNSGLAVSWHQIAQRIYELQGQDADLVKPINTSEYFAGNPNVSPRPKFSVLALDKVQNIGIEMPDWEKSLVKFLNKD
jgi:dTDP-4-dehydrorhamnose 3,5-epimerase